MLAEASEWTDISCSKLLSTDYGPIVALLSRGTPSCYVNFIITIYIV